MKNVLSIVTTVIIGFALAMSPACGKDKKPAAAKPDPNKTESTDTPSADDKPADDQPAAGGGGGGW